MTYHDATVGQLNEDRYYNTHSEREKLRDIHLSESVNWHGTKRKLKETEHRGRERKKNPNYRRIQKLKQWGNGQTVIHVL